MDKFTKILIVVVIILIAGLSLTVGLLFGNNLNKPLVINNTTNSSNSSTQSNQTNSTNQTINNAKSKYISASQAIMIAKAAWPVPKARYVISDYPTSNSPYYWVDVLNEPNVEGPGGEVKINAITGNVLIAGT